MTERSEGTIGAVTERSESTIDPVTERSESTIDPVTGRSDDPGPEERRALFRVVRGAPTDEEVAALAVVLVTVAAPGPDLAPPAAPNRWSDPAARLRNPLRPGPDAWRTSAWPR